MHFNIYLERKYSIMVELFTLCKSNFTKIFFTPLLFIYLCPPSLYYMYIKLISKLKTKSFVLKIVSINITKLKISLLVKVNKVFCLKFLLYTLLLF